MKPHRAKPSYEVTLRHVGCRCHDYCFAVPDYSKIRTSLYCSRGKLRKVQQLKTSQVYVSIISVRRLMWLKPSCPLPFTCSWSLQETTYFLARPRFSRSPRCLVPSCIFRPTLQTCILLTIPSQPLPFSCVLRPIKSDQSPLHQWSKTTILPAKVFSLITHVKSVLVIKITGSRSRRTSGEVTEVYSTIIHNNNSNSGISNFSEISKICKHHCFLTFLFLGFSCRYVPPGGHCFQKIVNSSEERIMNRSYSPQDQSHCRGLAYSRAWTAISFLPLVESKPSSRQLGIQGGPWTFLALTLTPPPPQPPYETFYMLTHFWTNKMRIWLEVFQVSPHWFFDP